MTIAPRTQGPYLFGRRYQVTIAPDAHQPAALQYGNLLAGSAPLRVTFDIKKTCEPTQNPGHIVIYNMASANRAIIKDGWAIQLQAGYTDTVQTIWFGQVGKGIASKNPDLSTKDKASEKKEGVDISYAIETAEAWGPMRLATINQSYRKGTPYSKIFDDVFKVMSASSPATGFGITKGPIPNPFPIAGTLKKKLVMHCSCAAALDKLFKPAGYDWFVHNNQLIVVACDDHTQDGIPFLSAETGLLGIPSRENGKSVSLTCMLNPQLAPGRLLRLESQQKSFNGYFKCRTVQHKGDSHGEDWTSQVECVPYDNPSLPISVPPIDL